RELPPTAGSFRDTDRPGVYQVAYRASDGTLEPGPIAVRSFDPTESGAVPRSIAVTTLTSGVAPETNLVREAAPWAIGATLLLISLEWWVGHQRPSLRRRVARA
ncbi:MAG: hypothetical protein R3246_15785, partial [Acidimicrobiia bacterium]|nr:hypothetical protein [Acidimicrobiia bacterium]